MISIDRVWWWLNEKVGSFLTDPRSAVELQYWAYMMIIIESRSGGLQSGLATGRPAKVASINDEFLPTVGG